MSSCTKFSNNSHVYLFAYYCNEESSQKMILIKESHESLCASRYSSIWTKIRPRSHIFPSAKITKILKCTGWTRTRVLYNIFCDQKSTLQTILLMFVDSVTEHPLRTSAHTFTYVHMYTYIRWNVILKAGSYERTISKATYPPFVLSSRAKDWRECEEATEHVTTRYKRWDWNL